MTRLQRLCSEHRDRIFGFAYHSLGSASDAEDVTQEVLIRLVEEHERIPDERVVPWLVRVTRNAVVDHVRDRRGRTGARGVAVGPEPLERRESPAPGPDAALELQQAYAQVARLLAALPERPRSIVILREVQGMSYAEVADAMGLSEGQVKVALHRARRQLRERRKDEEAS